MPRAPTNWKKLYQQSQELLQHSNFSFDQLAKLNNDLEKKHENLNKEFDRAVEINKKMNHTIIEQRGIIHYLEAQVSKMDMKITELEKK
jgi:hypothetical protein